MIKHKLGNTDLEISLLGLGTVKLGRNTDVKYPTAFNIPDDIAAKKLLAVAQELQINLLDTAPAYGDSEERLGKLLRGQRQNWVVCSKAGENYLNQQSSYDFRPQSIMQSIQRSLQLLHTDYIDILLIHSDGNDEQIIKQYEVFSTLEQAKKQGYIRSYGMSTKTVTGGLQTLQYADVAMVTYNPSTTEELAVIQKAHDLGKGIFIKKAFASGHSVAGALEFILKQAGVSSIILGTINPDHLRENVSAALQTLNSA